MLSGIGIHSHRFRNYLLKNGFSCDVLSHEVIALDTEASCDFKHKLICPYGWYKDRSQCRSNDSYSFKTPLAIGEGGTLAKILSQGSLSSEDHTPLPR